MKNKNHFAPLEVNLRDCNGNLEKAISRLSKMIDEDGVAELHLKQMRYEKPSDKKRRKRSEAKYRRSKLK